MRTRVLVTGGTGYLARHTLRLLLEQGYSVRATVRSRSRTTDLDPRVDLVEADLGADAGWSTGVAGRRYVLHVASPFPAVQPEDPDEVIRPARDGALRVLRAARTAGVERVVLTSSFAAMGYPVRAGHRYTEGDWTDPSPDLEPYVRSKAVAAMELAAMTSPAAAGRRFLLTAGATTMRGIADVLRDRLGAAAAAVPTQEADGADPVLPEIDTTRARGVLGFDPRPIADTIEDTARSLLD